MEQTLINLVLALSANALLHNVVEMLDKQERLRYLGAQMDDKHPDSPNSFAEDTPRRAYIVSVFIFVVLVTIFYGFFSLIELENSAALWTIITLLIVTYVSTVLLYRSLRMEIDRLFPKTRSKR